MLVVAAGAGVNWTPIVTAFIAALPSLAGLFIVLLNRRSLRTPSGDPIGHVAERAEHLSAADVFLSKFVLAHASGDHALADNLLVEALARHKLTVKEANGDA